MIDLLKKWISYFRYFGQNEIALFNQQETKQIADLLEELHQWRNYGEKTKQEIFLELKKELEDALPKCAHNTDTDLIEAIYDKSGDKRYTSFAKKLQENIRVRK